MPETCRECSASLTAARKIHLWDGHDYCRECVEAACSGMAAYAGKHPVLVATEPVSISDYVRNLSYTTCIVTSPFAVIFVAGSLAIPEEFRFGYLLIGIASSVGLGTLIFVLHLLPLLLDGLTPHRISVHDGAIEVSQELMLSQSYQWDDATIDFRPRGMVSLQSPSQCPFITVRRYRGWRRHLSTYYHVVKLEPEIGRIWEGLVSLQPEKV